MIQLLMRTGCVRFVEKTHVIVSVQSVLSVGCVVILSVVKTTDY